MGESPELAFRWRHGEQKLVTWSSIYVLRPPSFLLFHVGWLPIWSRLLHLTSTAQVAPKPAPSVINANPPSLLIAAVRTPADVHDEKVIRVRRERERERVPLLEYDKLVVGTWSLECTLFHTRTGGDMPTTRGCLLRDV